jgi:hypothetical protein
LWRAALRRRRVLQNALGFGGGYAAPGLVGKRWMIRRRHVTMERLQMRDTEGKRMGVGVVISL